MFIFNKTNKSGRVREWGHVVHVEEARCAHKILAYKTPGDEVGWE
jgi:hypothetical protein